MDQSDEKTPLQTESPPAVSPPAQMPAEGGSYSVDPVSGILILIERTQEAS